jgi:hypothetical protein
MFRATGIEWPLPFLHVKKTDFFPFQTVPFAFSSVKSTGI